MLLLALFVPALGKARPMTPSRTNPVRARKVPSTLEDDHEEALARALPSDPAQRYLQFEENLIRTLVHNGLPHDAYAEQVQVEAANYLHRHGDLSVEAGDASRCARPQQRSQ